MTAEPRVLSFSKPSRNIFSKESKDEENASLLATLFKADPKGASTQPMQPGMRQLPYDFKAIYGLMTANVHHASCIRAKRSATVGLGFSDKKVHPTLDPLCDVSWQDTLDAICDDYWMTGNGYLEVVRLGEQITGLHHVRAADVRIVVEDRVNLHYVIEGNGESFGSTVFAKFGEAAEVFAEGSPRHKAVVRHSAATQPNIDGDALPATTSELVHFRRAGAIDRWYGYADWIAAVTSIELVQMNHQHDFDFHNNRGVPEFILWVLGEQVTPENWKKIEARLESHVGLGNSRKSMAINLPGENIETRVDKLAMEGAADPAMFSTKNDTLALEIVSAHGVPPLLAGIQIPGKLGANNELPNALMAFQALVIGQAQHTFETTLAVTLGDTSRNGGLGLSRENFEATMEMDEMTGRLKKKGGLRTILDAINVGMADTVGRMREPLASAQANGRDLSEGVKD
ncbi:MAG: phage portal protein [Burkholderiales bacterium]|nr:phage portal protein [Burkholderiales bacterium]